MDLWRPDFSDSRDPIFPDSREPLIIFSDSRDSIFNSRDPNRVPETPLKKLYKMWAQFLRKINHDENKFLKTENICVYFCFKFSANKI